jgi:hypothetical protein
MHHSVTFEPVDYQYLVRCSAGDLNQKRTSRNTAFLACYLHVLEAGLAELELASAGKADHD